MDSSEGYDDEYVDGISGRSPRTDLEDCWQLLYALEEYFGLAGVEKLCDCLAAGMSLGEAWRKALIVGVREKTRERGGAGS